MLWLSQVQAEEAIATLKSAELHETFVDEVPVSGQVVVGIGLAPEHEAGHRDQLAVFLPEDAAADENICVQAISRDGRYWSKNVFVLPDLSSAAYVTLDYPTKHLAEITALDPDDFAVLASAGECRRVLDGEMFIADWRPMDDAKPDRVKVFVNSSRSDTFISARTQDGKRFQRSRCRRLQAGRRTGYDTICELNLSASPGGDIRIEILRRKYDRSLPPVGFNLKLER
jgi:hypothetical protein